MVHGGSRRRLSVAGPSLEVAGSKEPRKVYIDGELAPSATSRYQDIKDRPTISLSGLGQTLEFQRPLNPHAACFFLNERQMAEWAGRPYFLDRESSFFTGIESWANVGIMRTFRIYKSAPAIASILEVEHFGDQWIAKLASRDRRSGAPKRAGANGAQAAVSG